jgi:chromosome segregation ATPase
VAVQGLEEALRSREAALAEQTQAAALAREALQQLNEELADKTDQLADAEQRFDALEALMARIAKRTAGAAAVSAAAAASAGKGPSMQRPGSRSRQEQMMAEYDGSRDAAALRQHYQLQRARGSAGGSEVERSSPAGLNIPYVPLQRPATSVMSG